MQHPTLTTEQVRALIARGKFRDTLFQAIGILFLGIGLLVIFLLVSDMVMRGAERLNLDFFMTTPVLPGESIIRCVRRGEAYVAASRL